MHKNKEGKVMASLTEVKNRTGDIFALVDEFGEVYLTSYNKIRYRVEKVNISSILEEKKEKAPKAIVREVKAEAKAPRPVIEREPEVVTTTNTNSLGIGIINISVWDRNSRRERNFIDNSTKPLVNT